MNSKILILLTVILFVFCVPGRCEIVCNKFGVYLEVLENVIVDDIIYDTQCSDTLNGTLAYVFHSYTKPIPKKKFALTNGTVILNDTLNADHLHKFRLYISITSLNSASAPELIDISIIVLDVNDNDPVIKDLALSHNVAEDAAVGFKINTCSANDKDRSGVVTFYIRDPLSAEASSWYMDENTCDLYVNKHLDYETKTTYTITIDAIDQDISAPRSASQIITINIIDANDNYPACAKYYTVLSLSEDHDVGSVINTVPVTCTDADSGVNSAVSYALSASNNADTMDKFAVNPTNGDLTLTKNVDYETLKVYEVKVDVKDGGATSLTSTVVFGILLKDIDDNIPTWPNNPIFESVPETTHIGHIVFTVSANDIDAPNTVASTIKYELQTPPNPDWFDLNPATGSVVVKSIMNTLTTPWVSMDVLAYSTDKLLGFNVVTVNITLTDENNISPKFDQVYYQGNVSESASKDTYIVTVGATDPEEGDNGDVEYYLNSAIFKVDPVSGDISLKSPVDYETETVYSLKVEARDKGTPSLSGYTFVVISILPVNDFTPVIMGPVSELNILENTEPGSVLANITATDGDSGLDGVTTFSIQGTAQPFSVEPNTGRLRILNALDRDTQARWILVVIATDNSETNPKSSSTTVTINLLDINDNTPICDPLSNTVVTYPHQINSQLGTISCSDADEGVNAQFTYIKLSGDAKNAFKVDGTSGAITLIQEPTEIQYTLLIEIKDKGNPPLRVHIAYNILVELIFEFANTSPLISISENTIPSTALFDFDACCVYGLVRYEILTGNDDDHVVLDSTSGKLILRKKFDFETKTNFRYDIRATAVDTNTVTETYLDVSVEDSNDNIPLFDAKFQQFDISEDLVFPTSIVQLTATDRDSGTNGELVYSVSGSNKFDVDTSGNLRLIAGLDAEVISQYTLTITATDKGDVPLSGLTTVVINVNNVNEFNPVIINILNGMVHTTISEDAILGSSIIKLVAQDQDINTVITYSITLGNAEQAFIIDGSSGDILLAIILDRETTAQYNLTAEANTGNGETVSATVVIDVLDVNDNDPKFDQDFYQLDVTHEDPTNKLITTFIITDNDVGNNEDISSITIIDGDPNNHFTLTGNDIRTNIQVDYYNQRIYSLSVQAGDGGSPTRYGFTTVIVNVLPKFKPPHFLLNTYSINVREDISPVDDIIDMDATADGGTEGSSGTIEYIIGSNDDDKFFISDTTGIIHTTSQLDFELKEEYVLVITARSREDQLLSASTTVTITVQNINDNVPLFNVALFTLYINEDASIGDVVGPVSASDLDKAPYGTIIYSFGVSTGSTDFSIDSSSIIKVAASLNYITQSTYSIPVIINDGSLSSEALAVIKVMDVNDNTPTFILGTFSVDVVESMGTGQTFYTVKAEDLDTGLNSELKYTIVSGNINNQLGLNADSGALTVQSSLDRETHNRFDLVIRAEDKAVTGVKSGTLYLTVNVEDVNDEDPTFPKALEYTTINRADPPDSPVLSVAATDDDAGDNAVIVYEISGGNTDGLFLIGVNSGEIKTASSVTTAENEYNLEITARDKGVPARSGTTTVKVQVIPIVSAAPSDHTWTVTEERLPGEVVGSVIPNHIPTAAINFAIGGGNYKSNFQIDSLTGRITTTNKLNREEYPIYLLSIDVTDGSLTCTKSVRVDVLDVNDNTPIITTTDTNINVVENTPAGHIVAAFTVFDADFGSNAEVDLIISTSPISGRVYFEIDNTFLKIKTPIDYETTQSIGFAIFAVDRGNPKRTGTIAIIISVIDVGDGIEYTESGEAPSIHISRETSSSTNNGETVTVLTSTDFTIDPSQGPFTFITLNREDIFSIDNTGAVQLVKEHLIEPVSKYFVWVVMTAANGTTLGLLRIDTFDANKHLVSLESNLDITALQMHRTELELNLQTFFPPEDAPRIWKLQTYQSPARRKLLAAVSEALVYVIEGPIADVSDVEAPKNFKASSAILNALRLNPNADTPKTSVSTPNIPIIAVNSYAEPVESNSTQPEETFVSSTEGYITFSLLGLLLLIIIIIIIVCCIYKKKKRDKQGMDDSSEELVPPEPEKIKRKIAISKPTGFGKQASDISTDEATRKVSIGPAATTLPVYGKKRSTSVSPSRLTPIPPARSAASASDINIAPGDVSPGGIKSKPPTKRLLPIPLNTSEKQASTIDPSNGKTGDAAAGDDVKPVVTKRNNGPVVHRGKAYDGVGFDKEKNQRYAYNTKSGSTLWMEKDNGLGTGKKGPNGKKKVAPKLTVVSEAAGSNTPNLTLNRSIGMTSSDV